MLPAGASLGLCVGSADGSKMGCSLGNSLGNFDGFSVEIDGTALMRKGRSVGALVVSGALVGKLVVFAKGYSVGSREGVSLGSNDGRSDGS